MSAVKQLAVRHFGRHVVCTLERRGVRIIGTQALPDVTSDLPFAACETAYVVDDNGTGRVLRRAEVMRRVEREESR